MSTLLSSTGSPPHPATSVVEPDEGKVGASTPTVASNTDAPAPADAGPAEPTTGIGAMKPSTTRMSPAAADLTGSVALSVVASSHASLNEALKRLRLEFEAIKSSGSACDKAISTIDSLLIESESLLKDLISRSGDSGAEAAKKRRANAKRSGRRSNAKKEDGKSGVEDDLNAMAGRVGKESQVSNTADSPRRNVTVGRNQQNKRVPLSGIFGNDRPIRGSNMYYQSSPNRQVFRVDETMMQYRSPQYYSLMTETRYSGGPAPVTMLPRKSRPASYGRERDRDAAKKNKVILREKEEATLRNELRNATTIEQFTQLMEKANKMGMQFEVAAVNSRVAKLQAAASAAAAQSDQQNPHST